MVLSMQNRLIPPTSGYEEPDPDIHLDMVAGSARPWDPAPVLSNSFGFGGHNGCLVIAPSSEARSGAGGPVPTPFRPRPTVRPVPTPSGPGRPRPSRPDRPSSHPPWIAGLPRPLPLSATWLNN